MQASKTLITDIRYIKGVGPKRAEVLAKVGIHSIHDLLYYFPRRYDDRSVIKSVADLQLGEVVTVKVEVLKVAAARFRRLNMLNLQVGDATGSLTVTWFNRAYLKEQIHAGDELLLHGKVELYKKKLHMNSPEYEKYSENREAVHTARVTPIYPLTEGLFQRSLRTTLKLVVDEYLTEVVTDYLPESFRREQDLMELSQAVREMHFPSSQDELDRARRRIVFDEFLLFEITLLKKLEAMKTRYQAWPLKDSGGFLLQEFQKTLPFDMTDCQVKAVRIIEKNMGAEVPMNRLLMGDVGSGKTIVAAYAALLAARNQTQSALLVPTEILARQHYETFCRILKPFDLEVRLLTSAAKTDHREKLKAELKKGRIDCLIGTHAILQEDIVFKKLSCVIIDEQHKFGVAQRNKLLQQKVRPHQLVMTATPIPRTLALTAYADLDITSLRSLPKGRQEIKTYWIHPEKRSKVYEYIRDKVSATDEQAYIIFPLVEETEKADLLAATTEYEKIRQGVFKKVRIGLVHGQMHADERRIIMDLFKDGEIRILVATSVIEVGIDNPNATIIVIEHAERFGLSQLHQMRGRIGRGTKKSECYLLGLPQSEDGKKRLRLMTRVQDGFRIAEEDLKLRGPGDFWGTRQSGEPLFRVANPYEDLPLLEQARECAKKLLAERAFDQEIWLRLKNYLDQFPIHY